MSVFLFNSAKPATSSAAASAEIRNNFGALQSGLFGVNLVADPLVELWGAGDSSSPTHYVYTAGTGGTIARAGTSLGDTAVDASGLGWNGGNQGPIGNNWGAFCAKMVFGSSSQNLRQMILGATGVKSFVGQPFSIGAWVRTSTANAARIQLWDGVNTNYSSYHNGNGNWQWITATMASGIANTATGLWMYAYNDAGTVYYNGFTVVMGSVPPSFFQFAPIDRFSLSPDTIVGAVTVANTQNSWGEVVSQPAIVRETRMVILTAPTGQALKVNVRKTGNVMYTTNPQIAAGAQTGSGGQPDGTYANRCFGVGDYVSFDVTQVGSGAAGSNLTASIDFERWSRPTMPFMTIAEATNG